MEMYCLTVLEVKRSKVWNQGIGRAVLPRKVVEENLFFTSSSFGWLLAFLDWWPHYSHLYLCGHIVSSSSVMCLLYVCLSYKGTCDCIEGLCE